MPETDTDTGTGTDTLTIGRFQLENLLSAGVKFLFIDLRTESERSSGAHALFSKAMPMAFDELKTNLSQNQVPLDAPIILLDQDGSNSNRIAQELEALSFKNVYLIRGGAAQILSDSM